MSIFDSLKDKRLLAAPPSKRPRKPPTAPASPTAPDPATAPSRAFSTSTGIETPNALLAGVTYDPETGHMTPEPRLRYGVAYLLLNGTPHRADRIAYRLLGISPLPRTIRHLNGNGADLRWENIAPVEKKPKLDVGIHPYRSQRKAAQGKETFPVLISPPKWGKTVYLGTFATREEAREARDIALQRWKRRHPPGEPLPKTQREAARILKGEVFT